MTYLLMLACCPERNFKNYEDGYIVVFDKNNVEFDDFLVFSEFSGLLKII